MRPVSYVPIDAAMSSSFRAWLDALPWMDILLTPPTKPSNRLALAWHEFMEAASAMRQALSFSDQQQLPDEYFADRYRSYELAAMAEFSDDYTQALAYFVARNNLAVVKLQNTLISAEQRFNTGTPLADLQDEIMLARENLRRADEDLEKAVTAPH